MIRIGTINNINKLLCIVEKWNDYNPIWECSDPYATKTTMPFCN